MKSFVIAQHHGVFMTLESMIDSGIDDIVIIIPSSQVDKYNKMYNENPRNPEFEVFKDYDKLISGYIKQKNANIRAFVYEGFDIRNTVSSAINFINLTETKEIAACLLSGVIVLKDYRESVKLALEVKEFGMCLSRVYQNDPRLSMYHMLGLPQQDKALDVNFFVADMSKISNQQLQMKDSELLSDAMKRKQLTLISREFNGKDDVLIGTAISARQTIAHHLRMQEGHVINLWNKSIKSNDAHKSEEIFGYPFHVYGNYAAKVSGYLPKSTANKIISNGNETRKWTNGLYDCLDIIDL